MADSDIRNKLLDRVIRAGYDVDKISKFSVLIAGMGTIGCEVARILALYGVGKLILVDDDIVEFENVGRQSLYDLNDAEIGKEKVLAAKEKLGGIMPGLDVETFSFTIPNPLSPAVTVEIDGKVYGYDAYENLDKIEELVKKSDVVISGVDNFSTRRTLEILSLGNHKPFINTGIEETRGGVRTILPDEDSSCIGCYQRGIAWLRGGYEVEPEGGCTIASLSSIQIAAAIAADNFVKMVHRGNGEWKYGRPPNLISFDLKTNKFNLHQFPRDTNCEICVKGVEKYLSEGSSSILYLSSEEDQE